MKDFAPACERNKEPILGVLKEIIADKSLVLEIGSGTGQHASYFAQNLQCVRWQPSELSNCLDSIREYRLEIGVNNFLEPIVLDLLQPSWPIDHADAVVCINTVHIIEWEAVENLFSGVERVLTTDGLFFVYGPYQYRDRALEPSNAKFDQWLKTRDSRSGIREFEAVNHLARQHGLDLVEDRPMPANNRSIWWRRASVLAKTSGIG